MNKMGVILSKIREIHIKQEQKQEQEQKRGDDEEYKKQEQECRDGDEEEDYSDITLRLLDVSDVEDFMAWATDEKVCKFCSWEPQTFASKEKSVNYIIDDAIPHPWFRAICLKNRAIGEITVTPKTGNDSCRAEVGYVLGSKYWGKGIMTRVVKMVAANIFMEWPHLVRLEGIVDVDNLASQRVLEKAGFKREGVMRKYYLHKGRPIDMVMFSLLSTDPKVGYFV